MEQVADLAWNTQSEGQRARRESEDTSEGPPHPLFVVQERFQEHQETFSKLQSMRYRFQAYFGDDARSAIDGIIAATNRILITAKTLHELDRQAHNTADEIYSKQHWEAMRVVYSSGDGDPIADEVNALVKKVESIARPALTRPSARFREG